MHIIEHEITQVERFSAGKGPDYNKQNPITHLISAVESTNLSADREHYLVDSVQYLFPIRALTLYPPSGDAPLDPREQENKEDFQKQNIRRFLLADVAITRGYAQAAEWSGPFLHISFIPADNSPLREADGTYRHDGVKVHIKVGNSSADKLILAPYNEFTHRYELELWGFGGDLSPLLGDKGREALKRGELQTTPNLIRGLRTDFVGEEFDKARDAAKQQGQGIDIVTRVPDHAMHPLHPLHIELAWADLDEQRWDSQGGANYHYEFAMGFRGWNNYLGVGQSANPHGGTGGLEYRNLFSNYFSHEAARKQILGDRWSPELGRSLEEWNVDAYGNKAGGQRKEDFFSVNYMDLHIVKPGSAIGIHRHRDNQEVFVMLAGKALMVTGDWAQHDQRERAFELRTMKAGDLVLIKPGQLHALINSLDENLFLFMFGGYD